MAGPGDLQSEGLHASEGNRGHGQSSRSSTSTPLTYMTLSG